MNGIRENTLMYYTYVQVLYITLMYKNTLMYTQALQSVRFCERKCSWNKCSFSLLRVRELLLLYFIISIKQKCCTGKRRGSDLDYIGANLTSNFISVSWADSHWSQGYRSQNLLKFLSLSLLFLELPPPRVAFWFRPSLMISLQQRMNIYLHYRLIS